MTEQPTRPHVAPPIVENIPIELRQRRQWVCWAFEWRADKSGGGKWTKVPYTPDTAKKARSNASSSWSSFELAMRSYEARPDFFSGVGYMFLKNDPYVGGDRDHSLDQEGIPPTYAEISPSGCGVKFIGRACGDYGRKTVKGELYSSGRFFTITGNVLPGHERITECKVQIDAFLATLGNPDRPIRSGTPGNGSRAAAAAAVPPEDYAEGRRLLRHEINSLLARLRASVRPKAPGKQPQLYYILNEDYHGLQRHYPYAGVIRSDGSIDSSQVRAIFANGVRMRRFTFPQYIALFYHFYSAECLAKWGTTQAFREEAATLWFRARAPRTEEATPPVVQPAPRGRAGNHAELLDRLLAVLHTYRAGASAIVSLKDVGADLGVHKDTALRMVNQLVAQKRITKQKHGRYGGLLIDFLPELIYSEDAPDSNHQNGTSDSANGHKPPELIYETTTPLSIAVNDMPTSAESENDSAFPELIYSEDDESHSTAPVCSETTDERSADEREKNAPLMVYTSNTVYLQQPPINSEKQLSLKDAVALAFDELPRFWLNEETGEQRKRLITAKRVVEFVQYEFAERGWKPDAIKFWTDKYRKAQKNETFDELKTLKRDALEKKSGSVRKRIARAERLAIDHPVVDAREWYGKQAKQLQGQLALLGWELDRRNQEDAARIEAHGYSEGEQAEMLELVEQVRIEKPARKLTPAPSPVQTSLDIGALVDRLKVARTA